MNGLKEIYELYAEDVKENEENTIKKLKLELSIQKNKELMLVDRIYAYEKQIFKTDEIIESLKNLIIKSESNNNNMAEKINKWSNIAIEAIEVLGTIQELCRENNKWFSQMKVIDGEFMLPDKDGEYDVSLLEYIENSRE